MYRRLKEWLGKSNNDPSELRRAPRVVEPGVVVYYWNGSATKSHRLRDVSMTGAYLYTDERWYPGTIVRLLIQEPGAEARGPDCSTERLSVTIPARVVWHGPDGMALEFIFRTPDDRRRLEQLIAAGLNGISPGSQSGIAGSPANTRGQALIEFVLIFPLLFLLIVNAINFGAFFFAWITVADAARAGTQYWVLGSAAIGTPAAPTSGQVTTLVTNDISSLLNRSSLTVRTCKNNNGTVTCTGAGTNTPPADPEPATYISASVDVTYTFNPPIPLFNFSEVGVFATLPPSTIHRRAVMRMLQ